MKIKKLLNEKRRPVISISPQASVYDALKLMAEHEIGALVVLEDKRLVGILSERDYARKVILKGKSSKKTPVREIMTSEVVYTRPNTTLKKCMAVMSKNHFRHMPIVEDGRVVGMLSIEDLRSKL